MQTSNFLTEMSYFPPHFEPRDALLNLFDTYSNKRCLFLAAPAGYGKTISTLLWLRKKQVNFAWIALEKYVNIPSHFYRLIGDSLLSFEPENQNMLALLNSPDFSRMPVESLIQMIDEISESEAARLLVFDDLHLIQNLSIYKSLLIIQRRLPQNFRLILLTRQHIREEILEAIGPERCGVIHSIELAFTPLEIQSLYQKNHYSISLEEATQLHHATHGWPLSITAFAQKGYRHIDQSKLLEDFVEEKLWESWGGDLQQFMLKTAILDILEPTICNILTETNDSARQLELLRHQNSFLRKTGEANYRYHAFFVDFLQKKAQEELDIPALHKIAANYYLDTQDYLHGTHHAMLSRDEATILRTMVVTNQLQNPSVDEYIYFSKVLNTAELLEELCQKYPFLYVFRIGFYYINGDLVKLEHYLDRLEQALPIIEKDHFDHYLTCCLELMCDPRKSVGSEVSRYHKRLDSIEKKQGAIRVEMFSITTQAPLLHRSLENFVELIDAKVAKECDALFTRLMQADGHLLIEGIRCGLALEQNNLNAAMEMALTLQNHLSSCENVEFRYGAMLTIANVYYLFGEMTEYQKQINAVEDYIFSEHAPYLYPNILAFKTNLRLWEGDVQAAENWLSQYYVTDNPDLLIPKIYQLLTTIRANLVLQKNTEALQLATNLEKRCRLFNRPIDAAESGVLKSIIEWQLGHEKQACHTLLGVIQLIAPYQFIRVIANEGAAVLPILNAINPKKQSKLVKEFRYKVMVTAYDISKKRCGVATPVHLTKQQTKIITYLNKGYTYHEITEETGLSIHTVKSHVSAAYKKLGVNNAADAIAKAKKNRIFL